MGAYAYYYENANACLSRDCYVVNKTACGMSCGHRGDAYHRALRDFGVARTAAASLLAVATLPQRLRSDHEGVVAGTEGGLLLARVCLCRQVHALVAERDLALCNAHHTT